MGTSASPWSGRSRPAMLSGPDSPARSAASGTRAIISPKAEPGSNGRSEACGRTMRCGPSFSGRSAACFRRSATWPRPKSPCASAVRIADTAGAHTLAARIRIRWADVRVMRGAVSETEALDECAAAAAVLESAGEDDDALADALSVIGKLRFWRRDPSDQETLERAIALARASGNRAAELRALEWLAITFCDLRVSTNVAIERRRANAGRSRR